MRLPAIAFIALALAACGDDAPPTEPQVAEASEPAESTPAEDEDEATDLRDHMQSPIDKAKAVEEVQEDYDSEQAEEIDEQSDG